MSVLVLGGTAEARELASALVADGVDVVTSLAGAVPNVRRPAGRVRIGGFGGVEGLVDYLRTSGVSRVVDATHPFAERMTANAVAACQRVGVPLLRLERPSWATHPAAASWHWVDTLTDARSAVEEGGWRRVFLAVGRQSLKPFEGWSGWPVLVRVVVPPERVPSGWDVLASRGPFAIEDELALLRDRGVEALVTKDSGGPTDAKLDAAGRLGVPVVIVRRPALPVGSTVVTTLDEARLGDVGA